MLKEKPPCQSFYPAFLCFDVEWGQAGTLNKKALGLFYLPNSGKAIFIAAPFAVQRHVSKLVYLMI
jgi:hypothetical protein